LSGTRGVRHNVLMYLNLHFPEPESARVRLSAERQWAANMAYGPLVKFLPALAQHKHGFDVLFEALANGDRPLKAYFGLVLFTPPHEAVAALQRLRERGLSVVEAIRTLLAERGHAV
jgi:conjugal transfer ATP-binding protein TraC